MNHPHPLFDADWYLRAHPDVAAAGVDPLVHYLETGDEFGYWPHPLFDPDHYAAQQPDLPAGGGARLIHFLEAGGASGQSPHPLFDAHHYLTAHPDVAANRVNPLLHYLKAGDAAGHWPHPLFDPDHYGAQHPELQRAGGTRLVHFLEAGGMLGATPHPLFDSARYLASYPEVAASGGNPLLHYLAAGDQRDHAPHPLFDPITYGAQRPDVPATGGARLIDFVTSTGGHGLPPHPLFDAQYYMTAHPEAAASDTNALLHYIQSGDAAGHWPHPLFDPEHYGAQHPQLPQAGAARLIHFLETAQGDPHPLFDSRFYLDRNPEVGRYAWNPLVHYLTEGEALGYRPHPFFDPRTYRESSPDLAELPCVLDHYAHHGHGEGRTVDRLFDLVWYSVRYPEVKQSGLDPITYYCTVGDGANHWPNPLFDPEFYGAQNPDVPTSGGKRLLAYQEHADEDASDPHPLFSTHWYRAQLAALGIEIGPQTPLEHYLHGGEDAGLRPTPLFDPVFYLSKNPDLWGLHQTLASHYHFSGCREGRQPNPLFDSARYLERHPEVARCQDDPLAHYIHEGERCGDDPHALFDVQWYAAATSDLKGHTGGALAHFLLSAGSPAGTADPHPLFDTGRYREDHDLPDGGVPLLHYLSEGAALGYEPNALFNTPSYLREYAPHLPPRQTALAHFVDVGLARRNRPGPLFDFCVQFFRQADPALRSRGANPLAGWLCDSYARFSCAEAEISISLPASERPRVSIIVPAFGEAPLTLACLRALTRAETKALFEVIVVDDDPSGSLLGLAAIENLSVVRNTENLGFVGSCNRGAEHARGDLLVFLNNDALVMDGWLDALVRTFEDQPNAGIVGSRLLHPNGTLQEAGGIVYRDGSAANCGYGEDPDELPHTFARSCDYVSGAALMIPSALFRELSGFDTAYAPAFYEDTDLAFRVRAAGREVVVQPASSVVHLGGATCGRDPSSGSKRYQEKNRLRFLERWSAEVATQPLPDADLQEVFARRACGHVLVMDSTTLTPDQDSGSLRMFNLLRILRRMGFAVTFAPADMSHPEPYVADLQRIGVQVVCPPHATSLARFLEEQGGSIDLCILSRPSVGGRWLDKVKLLCPRATVLYDTVDLHYLRRERQLTVEGSSEVSSSDVEVELRSAGRADGVIVVSEYDREQLSRVEPTLDIHVVSNIHELYPSKVPFSQRSGVLFIGGFRHAPNVDAALWFVDEILPLVLEEIPEVVFHVVGSKMPERVKALAGEHVVIEGYVPDVGPFFDRCLLSVAPLRYGSGVKGKVNQSMSHALPCVATSIAAEGMEARAGSEILVADDARRFADQVIALHRDPELWQQVSQGGLESLERTFSMGVAEEKLREILRHYGAGEGRTGR